MNPVLTAVSKITTMSIPAKIFNISGVTANSGNPTSRIRFTVNTNPRIAPIPVDVVCAKSFAADAPATVKAATDVADDDLILDIGPKTAALLAAQLKAAGTIVWNGPVGVFEFDAFAQGTETIARAIAESSAFSIAGGGDTLAAIAKYGIERDIGYISTGGGAFLEVLEGKTLPAFEILMKRAAS